MDAGFSLQVIGAPTLLGPGGPVAGRPAQRHRLALLALLAAAPNHQLSRDKLIGYLWPEADGPRARHLLSVALHDLRALLGDPTLQNVGDDVRLDTERLPVDLVELRAAVERGDWAAVVQRYGGALLDGHFLPDAEAFDAWLERERGAVREAYREALEHLGAAAMVEGAATEAVRWCRLLVSEDPLNTRYVLNLLDALEAAGDRGNALSVAAEHTSRLEHELGITPDPGFEERVRALRDRPTTVSLPPPRPRHRAAVVADHGDVPQAAPVDPPPGTLPSTRPPSRRGLMWKVAIATSMGIIAVVGALRSGGTLPPVSAVAVAPFANRTGDPALDDLGVLVADQVRAMVTRLGAAMVLAPLRQVTEAGGVGGPGSGGAAATPWREVARSLGAGSLIEGSFWREGDSLYLGAAITSVSGGQTLAVTAHVGGLRATPSPAIAELSQRVAGALAGVLDAQLGGVLAPESPRPTLEAYTEFVAALAATDHGEHVAPIHHLQRALLADPGFMAARLQLAWALLDAARFRQFDSLLTAMAESPRPAAALDRAILDWMHATRRGDRFGSYRAAREAARLAPRSRWILPYAREATALGRASDAVAVLQPAMRADSPVRRSVALYRYLANAYHHLGRYEDQLRVTRVARDLDADLILLGISEASAWAGLGREDQVYRIVDEALATANQPNLYAGTLMQRAALELLAHGHEEGAKELFARAARYLEARMAGDASGGVVRWALVRIRMALGDLDGARALLESGEGTLHSGPTLNELGVIAARQGDSDTAARADSALAVPGEGGSWLDVPIRVYNRARIAAALGEYDRAFALLQDATAGGLPFTIALDPVHLEPAFGALRHDPRLPTLLRLPDPRMP